jgi:hypothetical protein
MKFATGRPVASAAAAIVSYSASVQRKIIARSRLLVAMGRPTFDVAPFFAVAINRLP